MEPTRASATGAAPSGGAGAGTGGAAAPVAPERVPTLQVLSLYTLVDNAEHIRDLRGVGEEAVGALLYLVVKRLKLTYQLSQVFLATGYPSVLKFFESERISLIDGIAGLNLSTPCRE
mmetsp:Transcript_90445/g.251671  ORF Transcript_90445/g.251671 Transcript_90445/m.251671 type:complete len:118 (+) Transcript_90445:219-572(+)